ncbi:hypothetical protein PMZ80_007739 [Knufia obscura]|uniref:Uncharacterized protein n=2 Tax=Knufia TaxID=430999 RepID=A0AAN8EFB4_9EURO|nr:hypothetical protein PMZ80_007739 [Knufia obscura]KAK5954273.1 hypothetical protein OHC33_004846 [Knufia fluminis]
MPVYLAHGFRWQRGGFTGARTHAIIHNLEDASTEYIQNEQTQATLLKSFRELYPSLMMQLEDPRTGKKLEFLEQYDPDDEAPEVAESQDFAYVCDRVITIAARNTAVPASTHSPVDEQPKTTSTSLHVPNNRPRTSSSPGKPKTASPHSSSSIPRHDPSALSINIEDAMSSGPAVTPQAWEALAELRDKLAEGEKIGWWVIYNGDPDRLFDSVSDYDDDEPEEEEEEAEAEGAKTPTQSEPYMNGNGHGILGQPLPSMLPPDLKDLVLEENKENENPHPIGMAIPHPPPAPPLERPVVTGTGARPKSSRSFTNPLKKRSSKANLRVERRDEEIPEPPKLKELGRKEGFRSKFFGGLGGGKAG